MFVSKRDSSFRYLNWELSLSFLTKKLYVRWSGSMVSFIDDNSFQPFRIEFGKPLCLEKSLVSSNSS